MYRRNRFYVDIDGDHFPDAYKSSDLYYAIDTTCWLQSEGDTLVGVVWETSDGITSSEDYLEGNRAVIKIATPNVGTYTVTALVTSNDSGKQQTKPFRYKIKVV
jgi:hypothetical protein